jgi:hypothetical protein
MTSRFIKNITNNKYQFFALKLILFFLIIFTLDFAIGKLISNLYFKQKTGRQYRATYSIEKTNEAILIFGSSRAYHHYIPSVIEDKLKKSSYNTGSPGQYTVYNYAVLKSVLKRYSPQIILLDISPGEFGIGSETYDRLSFLLPYYQKHEEIRPIVNLRSPYERIKVLSSIYPFNSSLLMILGGNSAYFIKKNIDQKGYKPLLETLNQPIEPDTTYSTYSLDNNKVNSYEKFIKDCIDKNIKLFVFISPTFIKSKNSEYSVVVAKEIAKRNNIAFFDYSNDTTFTNNPKLFADIGHLNETGSKVFSNLITDSLILK